MYGKGVGLGPKAVGERCTCFTVRCEVERDRAIEKLIHPIDADREIAGLGFDFVQDNHSLSRDPGTLRGLHYQSPPAAQTKLVRCVAGAIFDVAVDARKGSPTYGQWEGKTLTPETGAQLLVPRGFLHGFLTLKPDSEVQYKVDDFYEAACDGAVAWNDPDIGIDWPLDEAGVEAPVLSAKDAAAPKLADFKSPFDYA